MSDITHYKLNEGSTRWASSNGYYLRADSYTQVAS